jgi:GDP-mannose 4,6-dehydratase
MNILITGGTGFVGSHMCDYILKNIPDANLFLIKRWRSRTENIKHLMNNNSYILNKLTFIEADLLDKGSITNAIEKSKPDKIFHFASQSFPQASFTIPISTLQTNVIGTTNLLEAVKEARDKNICDPLIISISSSEVYGNPLKEEVPIKESNPIRAANPYSISKVGHDLMSQYYHKAYGLKIIITRMFSHEGSRRGKEFALSSFAHQIVNHERDAFWEDNDSSNKYTIFVGNLNSVRTYSHINDAIEAYWLCSTKGRIGEVYNIGGDYTCTVENALEILLSKSTIPREKFAIVIDPTRIRPTDITLQIPDCSKFKEHTGWKPKFSIQEICNDLLEYWRKNL